MDPKQIPRLSQNDNEIYEKFRKDFPNMNVAKLNEMDDLKSNEMKAKWRSFCEEFKHVEDYSFATLVRLDSRYIMKKGIYLCLKISVRKTTSGIPIAIQCFKTSCANFPSKFQNRLALNWLNQILNKNYLTFYTQCCVSRF